MRTLHKQIIQPDSRYGQAMPIEIKVQPESVLRSIGIQHGVVCVWYECDDTLPESETMTLLCVGTGHGQVPEGRYVSSLVHGPYVWHFYLPAEAKS